MASIQRLLIRLADFIINRAKLVATLLLIVTLLSIVYLASTGIRIDHSLESFLAKDHPAIMQFRSFTERYEPDDQISLIGFEAPDVFDAKVLKDLETITKKISEIDQVDEVISLSNFEAPIQTQFGLEVLPLITDLDLPTFSSSKTRVRVLSDSLAVGSVVNKDGSASALFLTLKGKESNYEKRKLVLDAVDAILAPYENRYTFHRSGIPHLRNNYVDMIKVETIKYILLTTIVIVLVLSWMFRSIFAVILPQTIVYLGTIYTVTVMMLAGGSLDILTSSMAAIILVVGVADSMHLLSRYQLNRQKGMNKEEAVRDMIIKLGSATFFTSATTAIGFGTLVTSSIIPLQRFGFYTGIGVLLTFAISILLIPSGIILWDKKDFALKSRVSLYLNQPMTNLARWSRIQRGKIVLACALIFVLGAWSVFNLRTNVSVNDDLGPRTQVYKDMEFFQNNIVSPFMVELVLATDETDFFKNPKALQQVAALQDFVEEKSFVSSSRSIADYVKRINHILGSELGQGGHEIPSSKELISQYIFLLELAGENQIEKLVALDFDELRVSVQMDDIGSHIFTQFLSDIDQFAESNLDDEIQIEKTGTVVLATTIGGEISRSLVLSIGLAFIFISIGMAIAFGSIRLLLYSLIPNVIPLLMTAFTMVILGIDLKPATAIIFTIGFGIAVDDTIHFLARYRQELRDGLPVNEAIRNTLTGTGRAIVLTSIVLFAGYSVLMSSTFQSLVYMGGLVAVTILFALLSDLVVLPALLSEKRD